MARKKRLTIAEERELMASTGDVEGIWQILVTAQPAMIDWGEVFQLLLRAVEVRSRTDPAGFAEEMFSRMFSLTSYLTLRSHHHARRLIVRHDRSRRDCGAAELPRELELVLPRLIELQTHLAEIAHARASVARLWELARCKKLEQGGARGTREEANGEAKKTDGPPVRHEYSIARSEVGEDPGED